MGLIEEADGPSPRSQVTILNSKGKRASRSPRFSQMRKEGALKGSSVFIPGSVYL